MSENEQTYAVEDFGVTSREEETARWTRQTALELAINACVKIEQYEESAHTNIINLAKKFEKYLTSRRAGE